MDPEVLRGQSCRVASDQSVPAISRLVVQHHGVVDELRRAECENRGGFGERVGLGELGARDGPQTPDGSAWESEAPAEPQTQARVKDEPTAL